MGIRDAGRGICYSTAMKNVDVLVIGAGTAGSNTARAASAAGAKSVVMIHPPELINTCIEEGCMPSKSILAGAHQGESIEAIEVARNAHIERLKNGLLEGFAAAAFSEVVGTAHFLDDSHVAVTNANGEAETYEAKSIVIASGSRPFVPPIPGLQEIGDKLLTSESFVSKHHSLTPLPKCILTIGSGPIGLELSTFLHDAGSSVEVLTRSQVYGLLDPEFSAERLRASQDPKSFPIHLNANLESVRREGDELIALIDFAGTQIEKRYDAILVATGREPNLEHLNLSATSVEQNDRGRITFNEYLQTSVPHIFIAGDVTGQYQILHFAAEMGKVAGHNAAKPSELKAIDYDRHMLAISFDQFPSGIIGLSETAAKKRGLSVMTATREFKNIGLGILKRQEYGLWKLVADKKTGRILGSQVMGPDSAGELVQILVPIIANQNTAADIINMTWYHPTYAEILLSLARDITSQLELEVNE